MQLRQFGTVAVIAVAVGTGNGFRVGISPLKSFQPQVVVWPRGITALNVMETRTIYREGSRVFLDARPRARYGQARVDGAYSLPGDDFAAAFATLDPPLTDDVPVLIYGEGPTDESPARVAEEMLRLGWKDVAVFPAGWQGWTRGKPATADTRR